MLTSKSDVEEDAGYVVRSSPLVMLARQEEDVVTAEG